MPLVHTHCTTPTMVVFIESEGQGMRYSCICSIGNNLFGFYVYKAQELVPNLFPGIIK